MIRHDLTQWPLVLSVMRGPVSLDDQLGFFAAWTTWLDRGERFATLRVFADTASLERPQGGAKEAKAWLDANRERIRAVVAGMATVVPPSCFDAASRMDAERLFGVPARTFMQVEDGVSWLAQDGHLADLDHQAVLQFIQRPD